jgi:tetratricopeptide (TPR) repeat protein
MADEVADGLARDEQAYRLYSRAREAVSSGRRPEAIEMLRSAAHLAPHFKTYELLGEQLLGEGQASEAILYLAAAVGLGNRQFRSRYLLAQALLRHDPASVQEAAAKLRDALEMNPDYKAARALLEQIDQAV